MILTNLIKQAYGSMLKPILFKLDPEDVHDRYTSLGNILGSNFLTKNITKALFRYDNKEYLKQNVLGIDFDNPVGLSAGFDKDANLINILNDVGFSFMQVGSITLNPYKGNPKPRLVRLPKSKALVVYYGLKNLGVDKILPKLESKKDKDFKIGVSIAKTNDKSTADTVGAINDYTECFKKVVKSDTSDFYTINISCPNTFGGEPFNDAPKLEKLLKSLTKVKKTKPMFVKMPINLSWNQFNSLLEVIVKYNVEGVIIGNLDKSRNPKNIKDSLDDSVKGGISGKPTYDLSNELISKTYSKYKKKLIIIGVGGIFTANDAYEKITRGATLVQLITGMIFGGPQTIGEINKGLVKLLKRDGFNNLSEAIGTKNDG